MVYAIPSKTRFEVKEMAGNIIPAIASTNAITAGMLVLQSLHVLRRSWSSSRYVTLTRQRTLLLSSWEPSKPNPECGTCLDHYIPFKADVSKTTLGQIVEEVAKKSRDEGGLGIEYELVVYEGNRLLADPDFDDNHEKTLGELGIKDGEMITLSDEDSKMRSINLILQPLKDGSEEALSYVLPKKEDLPELTEKPQKVKHEDSDDDDIQMSAVAPAASTTTAGKRKREDDETVEGELKKRAAEDLDAEGSKKRRTGEDESSAIVLE